MGARRRTVDRRHRRDLGLDWRTSDGHWTPRGGGSQWGKATARRPAEFRAPGPHLATLDVEERVARCGHPARIHQRSPRLAVHPGSHVRFLSRVAPPRLLFTLKQAPPNPSEPDGTGSPAEAGDARDLGVVQSRKQESREFTSLRFDQGHGTDQAVCQREVAVPGDRGVMHDIATPRDRTSVR
jgi:hypothetical protein